MQDPPIIPVPNAPRDAASTAAPDRAAPSGTDRGDPLAEVSFARASARSSPSVGDEGNGRLTLMIASIVLAGTVLWIAARALAVLTGPLPATIIGVSIFFFLPVLAVIAGGYNTPRRWRSVPRWADLSKRINVCAPPEALLRLDPIEDADFEPEYARILLVMPKGWLEGSIYAAGILASLVLVLPLRAALSVPIPGFLTAQIGALAAMLSIATLRQTYLRISPGRLDVLRFTMWKPTADSCRTFDLRSSQLVIDPRRRRLVLARPGETPSTTRPATTVSFLGALQPRRVAHALLRAAISTAPSPDLPSDRLHD